MPLAETSCHIYDVTNLPHPPQQKQDRVGPAVYSGDFTIHIIVHNTYAKIKTVCCRSITYTFRTYYLGTLSKLVMGIKMQPCENKIQYQSVSVSNVLDGGVDDFDSVLDETSPSKEATTLTPNKSQN